MDKTIHKKLTEKLYTNAWPLAHAEGEDMLASLRHEMKILQAAAKDLLQPRPEAIASIMEKARNL